MHDLNPNAVKCGEVLVWGIRKSLKEWLLR
jgi:hypothetical protein